MNHLRLVQNLWTRMTEEERDHAVNFHKYTQTGQRIEPQISRIYVKLILRVMTGRRAPMTDEPKTFGDLLPKRRKSTPTPAKPPRQDDCPVVLQGTGTMNTRFPPPPPYKETDLRREFYKRFPNVKMSPWMNPVIDENTAKAIDLAETLEDMDAALARDYLLTGKPFPEGMSKERKAHLTGLMEKIQLGRPADNQGPAEVLGEESDKASCELCNNELDVLGKETVICEGCGGAFCRKRCWGSHIDCDSGHVLTYDGRITKVGDRLKYVDGNKKVFEVTEIEASFKRFGICHGTTAGALNLPIRPRLMRHV